MNKLKAKYNITVNILLALTSLIIFFGSLELYARWKYGGLNVQEKGFYSRGKKYTLKKQKSVYRIVCVGGSTTFGGSDYKEVYPYYLEQILNRQYGKGRVEVINSGVAATATEFHRDLVKDKIGRGDLDMVVIHSFYNHFSPYYPLDRENAIRKILVEFNRVKVTYNWDKINLPDKIKIFLMERSCFYNLMREKMAVLTWREPNTYLSQRAGYLLKYSEMTEYNTGSEKELEKTLSGFLDRYHTAIEDMILAARSRHVEAVLIIPPYPYFSMGRTAEFMELKPFQYYKMVFEKAAQVLIELGRQYDIPVIDANSEFSKHGYSADLFSDPVHLSPKGNLLLADIIALKIGDYLKGESIKR